MVASTIKETVGRNYFFEIKKLCTLKKTAP